MYIFTGKDHIIEVKYVVNKVSHWLKNWYMRIQYLLRKELFKHNWTYFLQDQCILFLFHKLIKIALTESREEDIPILHIHSSTCSK